MKRFNTKQHLAALPATRAERDNEMKITEERIAELEAKGFKRWTKGSLDRLYINAAQLGLTVTLYKTGNIHSAEFRGASISNAQARRYKAAKTYIDINTGNAISDYDELAEAAKQIAGI